MKIKKLDQHYLIYTSTALPSIHTVHVFITAHVTGAELYNTPKQFCEIAFASLQLYQQSLDKPAELEATIELLQHSSNLVAIFNDQHPWSTLCDERYSKLKRAGEYFTQFEGVDPKCSFTTQTSYDILCTINGFLELLNHCVKNRLSIKPGYINSDIVENHFCMVRGLHNGASDHPTYHIYKSLQNSIILTQPAGLPKKRNSNTYIEPPAKKLHTQLVTYLTHWTVPLASFSTIQLLII